MFFSRLRYLATKFNDSTVVKRDIIRLTVRAGTGGQGLPRYNGVGGDGGDVYLLPRRKMSFEHFFNDFRNKIRIKAEHGTSSTQISLVGKHGNHVTVAVPLGAECVNALTNALICRCTVPNQKILIAKGGKGGCAANNYKGQVGESFVMNIHTKLHPNIGIVGFPNAGKSTLLKALAPEKKSIKIAPYPFTTTRPQILDIRFNNKPKEEFDERLDKKYPEDRFTLSCVDLPGIIEGAAKNRGKGHNFLKHLEYSDMILLVVDVHGFQLNIEEEFRSPLESIALINKEIELFDKKILKKPTILVLNKIDLQEGKKKADELGDILRNNWTEELPKEMRPDFVFKFNAILKTSAKTGEIGNLKGVLLKIFEELHPPKEIPLENEFESPETQILT